MELTTLSLLLAAPVGIPAAPTVWTTRLPGTPAALAESLVAPVAGGYATTSDGAVRTVALAGLGPIDRLAPAPTGLLALDKKGQTALLSGGSATLLAPAYQRTVGLGTGPAGTVVRVLADGSVELGDVLAKGALPRSGAASAVACGDAVLAARGATAAVLDPATGAVRARWDLPGDAVVAASPAEPVGLVGSGSGWAGIVSCGATPALLAVLKIDAATQAGAAGDGITARMADESGARVWDASSGRATDADAAEERRARALGLPVLRTSQGVTAVTFDRDGTRAAIGTSLGRVIVWDATIDGSVRALEGGDGAAPITALAWGLHLLVGHQDGTVRALLP